MLESGWECMVVTSPLQHTPGEYRLLLPKTKGSWSDLGLTQAPAQVWVWAQAGNWASGRGEGELAAQVAAPCN